MVFTLLPVATLAILSIRLQFGTTSSHNSIQSFSLQCLSLYSGVALLYSAGLFSASVINLSLSKILKSRSRMCTTAWNCRRRLVAVLLFCRSCAQAVYVPSCSIATVNRRAATAPHRKCSMLRLGKRCGEKKPSVRSLPFNPLKPELNPICYLLALLELTIFSTLAG